jgi:uncharacterized protein YerC
MTFRVEPDFREHGELLCQALQAAARASDGQAEDLLLRFLRDLLTPQEAEQLMKRWRIAQLLLDGVTPGKVKERLSKERITVTPTLVRKVKDFAIGPYRTGGYAEVHECMKAAQASAPGESEEMPAHP